MFARFYNRKLFRSRLEQFFYQFPFARNFLYQLLYYPIIVQYSTVSRLPPTLCSPKMESNITIAPLPPTKVLQLRVGRVVKTQFNIKNLNSVIFKKPLPSKPVYLGPLGLTGDAQAAPTHGGPEKAFVHYASAHYTHWKSELPESEKLLRYGGFGENLLTNPDDGYNEYTVCVGDIFAIGDNGVKMQVTQPRQPCSKLNHRLEVRDMALRAQNNHLTGWHNKVLVPRFI